MRITTQITTFLLFALSLAAPAAEEPSSTKSVSESAYGSSENYTIFNGQQVPPIVELSGETYKDQIKTGYWLVKTFSPYCGHCKHLAPKWQTLYEYYYTSDPLPASSEATISEANLNSFSRYYDFNFGSLDCVAFGTACGEVGVRSFPTIILFKDGVEVKRSVGDKKIESLSEFIEEGLESIRPGSRPKGGPKLPKVGADNDGTVKKPDVPRAKATAAAMLPNPDGKSFNFSRSTFEERVVKSTDPWFVKFYAPWCHHCQAMAPSWAQMAKEMQGKLNIGDVDCVAQAGLCKKQGVNSYPTILTFHGTERIEYEGLRGLGDLVSYAKSAADAFDGVLEVSAAQFEELEKEHDVIFLYLYDQATTSEDFQALERLPPHVISHAKVVKTQDSKLAERFKVYSWPTLIVSRDGIPAVYPGKSPQVMRDVKKLIKWMRDNWLPLVPELSAINAQDIMNGKHVVLAILNRERSEQFTVARRELKVAAMEWLQKEEQAFKDERQELRDAKQLRVEEAESRKDQNALRDAKLIKVKTDDIKRTEVKFAWVDGVFWERWIRTTFGISIADGERVIINDEDNRRYWDLTITGHPIVPTRTSILETLPKVVSDPPRLPYKGTGSAFFRFFYHIHRAFKLRPIKSTLLLSGGLVASYALFRVLRRRGVLSRNIRTNGYFRVGDEKGPSLLGNVTGQSNGKAD